MAWRIVTLVVQFLLELVRLIPKSKPADPKPPSQVPPADEPGKALDRARKRQHKPGTNLPN